MKKDILLNGASPMKLHQGFSACKTSPPPLQRRGARPQCFKVYSNFLGVYKSPFGGFRGLLNHPLYIK
jgi:hypothetical protein